MDLAELLDHISSQTQVTDQAGHKRKKNVCRSGFARPHTARQRGSKTAGVTETARETETARDRGRGKDIDRGRDRERHKGIQGQTETQTERDTDRETERQGESKTETVKETENKRM
jgi:hypothetical protein